MARIHAILPVENEKAREETRREARGDVLNLAIASPSASKYSEGFIRSQLEGLPHVLRIHGGPVASETDPGGPIVPMRTLRGLRDTLYFRGLKRTGWHGPQSAELARRMRRARVDVVLANFGPMGVALSSTCRRLSVPLIVHFHGMDAHLREVILKYREDYQQLGKDAAAVIVVSHAMSEALQEIGFPSRKLRLLRYGADPECFRMRTSSPERPVFVAFSRFVDKKAPHLTVLAFKRVHERFPEAKLIFAGDGVLLESTRNVVQALGLGEAVEFPGVLGPGEVAQEMRGATAFVQHSLVPRYGPSTGDSEGTPVVVLEAMLAGLPIVATRHAGIGEVIQDGHTGLLVEERDVEGMARAMVGVLESPARAAALGEAASREALDKYTVRHYIAALEEVIGEFGR